MDLVKKISPTLSITSSSANLIEVEDKCGVAVLSILLAVEHDNLPARHHDVELFPPVPEC